MIVTRTITSRGGGSDPEEDLFDEHGKSTQRFIASFESELAGIRREAEQEAENEIRKLREFIERKDDAENEQTDHNCVALTLSSSSFDNCQRDKNELDHEYQSGSPNAEAVGQAKDKSDVMSTDLESAEAFIQPDDKNGVRKEEESPLVVGQTNLQHHFHSKLLLHLDHKTPSQAVKSLNNATHLKHSATRSNKRKLKKKRKTAKKKVTDEGQAEEQTSMLPPPIKDKPGIWFYLRSDLGRVLCLFVATALLAILTERLQHQTVAQAIV